VILSISGVQFSSQSLPSPELDSYGNELFLVVLNHGDTSLFRNDLDMAHPLTIQDGVDNIVIEPL